MNFTSRHALRGWSSSTWTSLFNRCHSTSAGTGTFTEVIRKHLGGFLTQGRWLVFHRMNLLRGWKGESLTYFCWVVFWGGEDVPSPMLLRNRWERVGAKNYTASTSGEFLSGFFWGSFPLFFLCQKQEMQQKLIAKMIIFVWKPEIRCQVVHWVTSQTCHESSTVEALVKISSDWIRCLGRYTCTSLTKDFIVAAFAGAGV